jgi:hypothetical protein
LPPLLLRQPLQLPPQLLLPQLQQGCLAVELLLASFLL